jgi:hypothetical protein
MEHTLAIDPLEVLVSAKAGTGIRSCSRHHRPGAAAEGRSTVFASDGI